MKIKNFLEIDKDITLIALSYLLNKSKNYLLLNDQIDLNDEITNKLNAIIKKVKNGYPLQYALGRWNFYGLDFITDERALIPRPETELLVEKIIKADIKKEKILDIGTGTGAIAISLAFNLKESLVSGIDISESAIELANENKEKFSLDNVDFFVSDLFSNVFDKYNVLVSNPPYINKKDYQNLDKALFYEPKNALYGGDDGLFFYKKIIGQAKNYLKEDGCLFLEIGYDQRNAIEKLLEENSYANINSYKDYNGFDRIVFAQVKEDIC
ncbi:MAG: peptide chain release factor N(5)-glutamine methyltransferase [Peptoniphilaceae bacterium]|nr:peptide chain release factor N(5)-glutamine methyltransferase [Peptoniphilaceae bacterium]MDY6019110.1 peptide chain release factor N(5)-glutamine methyltransferase [Anaerococcus sp.]